MAAFPKFAFGVNNMKMKIGVGVIGPGFIGGEFIKQIASQVGFMDCSWASMLAIHCSVGDSLFRHMTSIQKESKMI